MITCKFISPCLTSKLNRGIGNTDQFINLIRNISKSSILERKVNLKKPRPPFYPRALLNEVTKPKFPPNIKYSLSEHETCQILPVKEYLRNRTGIDEENPYEDILARELLDRFNNSKMIAILHQNSMLGEDKFSKIIAFKRIGIDFVEHGCRTVDKALKNTKYHSIMPLFKISEVMLFSQESKVAEFLKVLKKNPEFVLMATIIDDRILSRTETEQYAATNLQTQRALLCQTLLSAATTLTSQLNHHPQMLVSGLDQHSSSSSICPDKQKNKEASKENKDESAEDVKVII